MEQHFIHLNKIRLFAHHGVLPQEQLTGAYFSVSVKIEYDFSRAIETDELEGTISYADVFVIIKKEMAVTSKLLEHVGGRITKHLKQSFPEIKSIELSINKENPPMGAECAEAGIDIKTYY